MMSARTYASYEEAAAEYVAEFNSLLQIPAGTSPGVTRGAGEMPAQVLVERADAIADISASMIPFAESYLESPDATLREGISGQLLAQAAAELQVASELLQIAEEGERPVSTATTRSTRGSTLRRAIDRMDEAMKMPVSQGLVPAGVRTRAASAATPEAAKQAIQQAANTTVGAITLRVRELGGDIVFDLMKKTEWLMVVDGVKLLNKDIGEKLDKIKEGVSALIARAVNAATKMLLNVYDKILALLGKDAEDQARKKIKEWLEEIKQKGELDLFEKFIDRMYDVEAFKKEAAARVEKTTAALDQLNKTTDDVTALSEKFKVLTGYIGNLEDVIVAAKFIKVPQVLTIIAGLQILLLAVTVYTGYDYIGYRPLSFPNLTKGVGEVIQERLVS